jgi:hypothetical protein
MMINRNDNDDKDGGGNNYTDHDDGGETMTTLTSRPKEFSFLHCAATEEATKMNSAKCVKHSFLLNPQELKLKVSQRGNQFRSA